MPTNLTDVDTFTDPVSVPAAGDNRTSASVETPFQALANRTRNLKNRADGIDAANHTWSGTNSHGGTATFTATVRLAPGVEITYPSPVSRSVTYFFPNTSEWTPLGTSLCYRQCSVDEAFVVRQIWLPSHAKITAVRARMRQGAVASPGALLTVRLWKEAPHATSGFTGGTIIAALDSSNTAGSIVTPQVTGLTEVVNNSTTYYGLMLIASDAASSTADQMYNVTVDYEEDRLVVY